MADAVGSWIGNPWSFPATVAMFMIVRRWVREDEQGQIIRPMWGVFKSKFIRANIYGYAIVFVGAVLYLNFHVIQSAETTIPFFIVLAYLFVVTVYLMVVVTILPIAIHFEGGTVTILKHTIQFILGKLHLTILFGTLIWGIMYLSLVFPVAILFFSGSVGSYMLMWFFNRSLEKLEAKQFKENEVLLRG